MPFTKTLAVIIILTLVVGAAMAVAGACLGNAGLSAFGAVLIAASVGEMVFAVLVLILRD